MKYTTNKIRNMFLQFFKKNGHKIVTSSSLIPKNNSNLLFTNAGMNQFQNVFLGKEKYNFSQVVTAQRCLRTGGKHNDLEQVGYSKYHHTFFEMLGNFSFGSYFKKEAILYAWELLTSKEWFNLPHEKLLVTVHYEDHESYNIWKNIIGLSTNNIIQIGKNTNNPYESDNFWQMGDTGPCGPCTEIFFKKSNDKFSLYHLQDQEKYIEIWNIVFIQFNRTHDKKLIPLSTLSVDTGMGLERISSILQQVHSNYEIDSFQNLIQHISQINNINISNHHQSIHVIADHIRAAVFIIGDNILPDNEHRGYILRRIIRRALRHGDKIGIKSPFFYKLVSSVIQSVGQSGIYLKIQQKNIEQILKKEELQFNQTLSKGLKLLKDKIKKLKKNELDGNTVFYLYDTFGFPIDFTEDICQEYNININYDELKKIQIKQKIESKKNLQNTKNTINMLQINAISTFKGYGCHEIIGIIKKIFINGEEQLEILTHQKGMIILDRTPFYGESGGQIGDSGIIYNKTSQFHVQNTQNYAKSISHIGQLYYGKLKINDIVTAKIDKEKRTLIQNNHSATHLLNAALKIILGTSIYQKGSFINEKYLRLDFTYPSAIDIQQIFLIEKQINTIIQKNITINHKYINFHTAISNGYIFLQNKNYDSIVRTIKIGKFSKELCRGTHANQTGEIGLFKIIYEKNISHGIHRIEAVTGKYAIQNIQLQDKKIFNINQLLHSNTTSLLPTITKLIKYCENLEKENNILNKNMILHNNNQLIKKIVQIKGIKFLNSEVKITNRKVLKTMMDQLKNKIHTGIIILFYQYYKKHIFIIGVTNNLTHLIQANHIVNILSKNTNGSGGGKPEIAECIARNTDNLSNIMHDLKNWIISKI